LLAVERELGRSCVRVPLDRFLGSDGPTSSVMIDLATEEPLVDWHVSSGAPRVVERSERALRAILTTDDGTDVCWREEGPPLLLRAEGVSLDDGSVGLRLRAALNDAGGGRPSLDRQQGVAPWPGAQVLPAARLIAPRHGISLVVLSDATPTALWLGPGRVADSAAPGSLGNVVLAGHRDTHFRFLENARRGDDLILVAPDGLRHRYRIVRTEVFDGHTPLVEPTEYPALTLVTCWPFDAIGPAPLRLAVRAAWVPAALDASTPSHHVVGDGVRGAARGSPDASQVAVATREVGVAHSRTVRGPNPRHGRGPAERGYGPGHRRSRARRVGHVHALARERRGSRPRHDLGRAGIRSARLGPGPLRHRARRAGGRPRPHRDPGAPGDPLGLYADDFRRRRAGEGAELVPGRGPRRRLRGVDQRARGGTVGLDASRSAAVGQHPGVARGAPGSGPVEAAATGHLGRRDPRVAAGRERAGPRRLEHAAESIDLLLLPHLVADQPLATFLTRGPYLQAGPDRAVTVCWRTDRPTDGRVVFGTRPGTLDHSRTDPRVGTEHAVRLEGLEPDTVYHYAVGATTAILAGDDGEHVFRTAPPPGARRAFRAWVLGDSGTAGANVEAVREGFEKHNAGRPVALWIMLGDNAYKRGTDDEYQAAVFDIFARELRRKVLWTTPGNHDELLSREPPRGPYYDIFVLPERAESGGVASGTEAFYSFDHGNVHFVSLNSEHLDPAAETAMLSWLERDLAAARSDWIVAFCHRAPYGRGYHDSDVDRRMVAVRTRLLPLFDAGGVDLVLAGHTHAYVRSWLIRGHYGPSETLAPEMVLDARDGRPEGAGPYRKPPGKAAQSGIVYVIAGSAGEATETDLSHPALPIGLTRRGSVVLDFEGDRLEARFVDWTGTVRDHFAIVKDGAPAAGVASSTAAAPAVR
jgi:LPXTG-site transpeptidase (sortase) family protein